MLFNGTFAYKNRVIWSKIPMVESKFIISDTYIQDKEKSSLTWCSRFVFEHGGHVRVFIRKLGHSLSKT